jgi:hypothetical protein
MFVEPAGSCLVTASPFEPAGCVAGRLRPGERVGEQSPDLADGERDEAGVGGRRGVRAGGRRGLGVGAVPERCGGDGADRESGHDQHDVPQDGGVEAGLALVQAEAALSQLEALLNRPPLMLLKWKRSLA